MELKYKRRFLKLARFLEGLKKEQFDFLEIIKEQDDEGCGTVCCAVGWLPAIFPSDFSWKTIELNEEVCTFFNIDVQESWGLFVPDNQWRISKKKLGREATSKEVAKLIREFVEEN